MPTFSAHDQGRNIDWSLTSDDYAVYRPGYPQTFYDRIHALGVGVQGQRVLDLGTGTGVLARQFASRGAFVTGLDIAEGQINAARRLAQEQSLDITFDVRPAEDTGQPDNAFDLVCAAQCFLYFDKPKAVAEIKRVLDVGGRLFTSYIGWLPREDPIAAASEKLVLQHNPAWSAGDWSGDMPPAEPWSVGPFEVVERIAYKEPITFTRASWRGRIRACRGIGATLSNEVVEAFDREHDELLREIADEQFDIVHRIGAYIYRPND